MQSLSVSGYTREEVVDALHSGLRRVRFSYDLLNNENETQGVLNNIMSGSIDNNSLATKVKRTAKFRLRDSNEINFLADRIRPWFHLRMPDGGEASWPLGIFLLSTPTVDFDGAGKERDVEAYDQIVILMEDLVEDRYVVDSGVNYIEEVRSLLSSSGVTDTAIISSDKTLPSSRDWAPGTSKLKIVNDLLESINFTPLHFNSSGRASSTHYQRPNERGPGYEYIADRKSVLSPGLSVELDLFEIANKWVATVSEADRPPLKSVYTNSNPESPTSTVQLGRTIVDFREVDAADQESLDSRVERIASEASQVYEIVDIETALMPHHENNDIVKVTYPEADLSGNYSEHKWSMNLEAGGMMSHKLRRVVTI